MSNLVDRYIQLESSIAQTGLEISVSEVHGTIVGAIANHMKSSVTPDLLKLLEPNAAKTESRYANFTELLYELYRENSALLIDGKEGFDLLLPDADEPLEIRVDAVATWCKGYLLGLLYNNTFSIDQIPESGPEIARDFLQIAEASAGQDSEQQEDWALGEIEEYLKVGAQLIFEFIYSERASEAPALKQ